MPCGSASSCARSICSRALTPQQLTDVAEHVKKRHFTSGETIIREGEPGEEFFVISDGEVDVVRSDHEVARLGPGDFFGEVALISGEPRNATVVAEGEVDTYVLGKTDFETALADQPAASATSSIASISRAIDRGGELRRKGDACPGIADS